MGCHLAGEGGDSIYTGRTIVEAHRRYAREALEPGARGGVTTELKVEVVAIAVEVVAQP